MIKFDEKMQKEKETSTTRIMKTPSERRNTKGAEAKNNDNKNGSPLKK